MANLKTMYPGVTNSPETYLKENVAPEGTAIYVNDASVLGDLPTLAVIGIDQNAETVLVKSVRSDGGLEIQRAVEGLAKRWDKATVVARNFTNYDYRILKENIELLNSKKIEGGDLKTRLSEMTSDSTHRTVSDSEKSTWNNKLSSVSGQDISRSKTKGYNTSSTWQSISSSRDLEDWIGDFDKRSRENKDNINKKVDAVSGKGLSSNDFTNSYKSKLDGLKPVTKQDIKSLGFPEHIVLTETAYNALSSAQKSATDIFYYIK